MATIGGLLMPDMYAAFQGGLKDGQGQLAQRTLQQNAQGAIGGDAGALAKIYGVDPGAGMKIQQFGQQQKQQAQQDQDTGMTQVGKYARMITALASSGDIQGAANLYKTIYPQAAQVLGANLPQQFDPSMLPHMKAIADSMDPQSKSGLINVGAGGAVFDPAQGKTVYTNPGVEKPAQIVTINRPDGTTQQFQNTPQGLVPLHVAPQGEPQGQASPPQAGAQDPMNAIIQRANALAQSGVPDDQVQQFIRQQAKASGV